MRASLRFNWNILRNLDTFDLSELQRERLKPGWISSASPLTQCPLLPASPSSTALPNSSSMLDANCTSSTPSSSDDQSLAPFEVIRNESVRSLQSAMVGYCQSMGDTQKVINSTNEIFERRIIAPKPSRPPPPSPPSGSSSSPSPTVSTSAAISSQPSESENSARLDFERPIMVCASTQTALYGCDICGFDGRDNYNLRRHKDTMHKPRDRG